MAKATSSGDPLAIKFHATASNRDISFEVLKKLVNKVSRQYLVAPPAGLTDAEVRAAMGAAGIMQSAPCPFHDPSTSSTCALSIPVLV